MRRPYLRKDTGEKITRYTYPISSFSGIDAETREDSLPLNYATYLYNVAVKNGVLSDGFGIEYPSYDGSNFPDTVIENKYIRNMYYFKHFDYQNGIKSDRIIAMLDDNYIYQCNLNAPRLNKIDGSHFVSNNVTFLNYYSDGADYVAAISDLGEMMLYDGVNKTLVSGCPNLNDACVHYGRIFGIVTKSNRIYFSALLNPANWSNSLNGGGYITMTDEGGLIKRIMSFKDCLYIFREYAIYKLTAYADQTEFTLSKVYTGDNKIYEKTIAVCNDRILFVADDGFYSFDGYTIKKILRNIFPLILDNSYASACYFNHKYYLATKIMTDQKVVGDEKYTNFPLKNNGIICCDLDLGEISVFRGGDIKGFMPVSTADVNKMFVYFRNYPKMGVVGVLTDTGKYFSTPLFKKWVSPKTNFETLSKDKVLKRIYISSTAPVSLTARLEEDVKFDLSLSYKAQMVPVNKRADKIGLVIETNSDNFALSGMLLEFDLIRRHLDE